MVGACPARQHRMTAAVNTLVPSLKFRVSASIGVMTAVGHAALFSHSRCRNIAMRSRVRAVAPRSDSWLPVTAPFSLSGRSCLCRLCLCSPWPERPNLLAYPGTPSCCVAGRKNSQDSTWRSYGQGTPLPSALRVGLARVVAPFRGGLPARFSSRRPLT